MSKFQKHRGGFLDSQTSHEGDRILGCPFFLLLSFFAAEICSKLNTPQNKTSTKVRPPTPEIPVFRTQDTGSDKGGLGSAFL